MVDVILIDKENNILGQMEKIQAHIEGKLHRAFSILVFNKNNELLIQKRAETKYHCPGIWANTCCSHPKPGENIINAAHKRLKEELGFDCNLEEKFKFHYQASFNNGLTENELDTVFIGNYNENNQVKPNPEEIQEIKWINIDELKKDIKNNSEKYSVWLKIILEKLI